MIWFYFDFAHCFATPLHFNVAFCHQLAAIDPAKYYSDLAGPENAAKYKTLIFLPGSASAEVIAHKLLV